MVNIKSIIIEGKIVAIEHEVGRNYGYRYMLLRVRSNGDLYSILFDTKNINKIGYLPRVGHRIHVEGKLYPPNYYSLIPSIKYVSVLKHIE